MARILDGTAVGKQIREELRPRIAAFTARAGRPPGLGIVLAGDDPASAIYVGTKLQSAGDIGCRTDLVRLTRARPMLHRLRGCPRTLRCAPAKVVGKAHR